MSLPSPSKALIRLIREYKIQNIAEIGVWKTQTAKKILRKCHDIISQYWGIDHWQTSRWWRYRRLTDEEWEIHYFNACHLMCHFFKLHIVRMTSLNAVKLFPEEYFDLVFIDADHSYESVVNDIKIWLPLVKKGGWLTGHDYYDNKKNFGVIKAVDENFSKSEVEITSECVWITRKV